MTGNRMIEFCPEELCVYKDGVAYPTPMHSSYYSTTCGMNRDFSILLPDGYGKGKKYPVLYMLHGIFGDEYSLINDEQLAARAILGNMINSGEIPEMIIVFPNMFATSDMSIQPDFTLEAVLQYDNFINDLTNDLMPYIESTYSVLTGRENTLLAGFSMGGRETLFITLSRPELFCDVCAVAPAPGLVPSTDVHMIHVGQLQNDQLRFPEGCTTPDNLIVCCGTQDSVVVGFPKLYHDLLTQNGCEHIWYEVPGEDHNAIAIRSGLYNLLKTYGSKG